MNAKMEEWMQNGCRLGWLFDADGEVVYVISRREETVHNSFDVPLSGEPVLPGFAMILSELRV